MKTRFQILTVVVITYYGNARCGFVGSPRRAARDAACGPDKRQKNNRGRGHDQGQEYVDVYIPAHSGTKNAGGKAP